MARPTKFSKEIADRIVQLVRAGNYAETAAAASGINKSTLYAWLKEGARAQAGAKNEFSNAIEKAAGEAEAHNLALIGKAAIDGQWQAAAWRLERMHHDRYGQRARLDQKVAHSYEDMTDEQLEARFNALADKLGLKELPREAGLTESAVPGDGADLGLKGENT